MIELYIKLRIAGMIIGLAVISGALVYGIVKALIDKIKNR